MAEKRTVTKVAFPTVQRATLTRVAAYARVSSGKDAMLHSLSAQVTYYSTMIQRRSGWLYAGVYADEALTGTKEDRGNFQRMLQDCRLGKIDLVITKSISRFARNTVTLLQTVRELKSMGVDVYFEEQNIHTMSADGELMLTILASYAQEESLSASENQKWRVRRNFEDGKPWNCTMLGYRHDHGKLVVVPDEATIVQRIFAEYLSGKGTLSIVKGLNADAVLTRRGFHWGKTSIDKILRNEAYTGNLLLQKTYRENHLTKRTLPNNGELPMYCVAESHEAIIDQDIFGAVQAEMQRRAAHYHPKRTTPKVYPFTGMVICGICGKSYRRKVTSARPVWICQTFNTLGKASCPSKQIPEETLMQLATEVLGTEKFDADTFHDKITAVQVLPNNEVTFLCKDGSKVVKRWSDRSRRESWTQKMRETARQQTLERSNKK